jgi:hypothetical protein
MSSAARFLREHVLELPIHQDLTADHMAYVARQVSSLRVGARGSWLGTRGVDDEIGVAGGAPQTVARC